MLLFILWISCYGYNWLCQVTILPIFTRRPLASIGAHDIELGDGRWPPNQELGDGRWTKRIGRWEILTLCHGPLHSLLPSFDTGKLRLCKTLVESLKKSERLADWHQIIFLGSRSANRKKLTIMVTSFLGGKLFQAKLHWMCFIFIQESYQTCVQDWAASW